MLRTKARDFTLAGHRVDAGNEQPLSAASRQEIDRILDPGRAAEVPQQPGEEPQPQPGQQGTTQPTPNPQAPTSPAQQAAAKAISDAIDALRTAQSSGDFKAYGEALDRLNKAAQQFESASGGN